MSQQDPQSRVVVRRADRPGDLGWVVMAHGEVYDQQLGWDTDFEALVARIVADYATDHDPAREAAWIAEVDGERAGCIFLVAGDDPGVAKLRILLVTPTARGLGVGTRLVQECLTLAPRRWLPAGHVVDQRRAGVGAQDLSSIRVRPHGGGAAPQLRP